MKEKIKSFSWKDILNLRLEIFRFCAIWIVLFHIYSNIGISDFPGSSVLSLVIAVGNCSVDIFLFLSAIGLYHSMSKNSVRTFYKNRVVRVMIPFVLVAIPFFIWFDFFFAHDGVGQFLLNFSTLNYWLSPDYPVWYVSFILFAYTLFPLLYKADVKTKHITTIGLIALAVITEYVLMINETSLYGYAERAFSRIPVFLVGLLVAKCILSDKGVKLWHVISCAVIGIVCFAVLSFVPIHIMINRYLCGIMGICIIVVYGFLRKCIPIGFISKALTWLGAISFEIYIVHVFMLRVIKHSQWWDHIPYIAVWYMIVLAATVAISKLVSAVSALIKLKRTPANGKK